MKDPFNKLARMMRTQPKVLLELEQKMSGLTGQEGVFEDIIRQNDITVDRTLAGLGLTRRDSAAAIRSALVERLGHLDRHLYEMLDKPDLTKASNACAKLCETVLKIFTPPKGLFLKRERAMMMLEKYPPHSLLEHFGYATVKDLIDKEGFAAVFAALRFTQSEHWMHQFFDIAYSDLKPEDFEERDVELMILDIKWLPVSEKFVEHKYHNVSHLKEFGIIFVLPMPIDMPGEMLRLFTLMLHYLHEVPFYAELFRHHMEMKENFPVTFRSLLRGDVPTGPAPDHGTIAWRVVQRYLAKDNEDDFRLFEPHVNPEADHWWKAEEDLARLSRVLGRDHGGLDLGWWTGLDYVGEMFADETGKPELVSFDLIDLLMSLAQHEKKLFLYHQQEALWNKVFIEYMGRDRLEELIEQNIISGFIILK